MDKKSISLRIRTEYFEKWDKLIIAMQNYTERLAKFAVPFGTK